MKPLLFRFRYLLLVVAFVPLTIDTFYRPTPAALQNDPDSINASASQPLPFLPAGSEWPWAFAVISGGLFVSASMFLLNRDGEGVASLVAAGLFTATAGIALLFTLQGMAENATSQPATGSRNDVLIHYALQLIAYCYHATDNNEGSMVLQVLAYTFSVGLCEEITKLLPVLYKLRKGGLSGDQARLLGFASGIGFGVAEGVLYSQRDYNGTSGGMIYLVRFVSCVAFHGFATATSASLVVRAKVASESGWSYFESLVRAIFPVMILHALYDTFCDRDFPLLALFMALGIYSLLILQMETEPRRRLQCPQGVQS